MAAKQNIFGLVDARGQIGRSSLVGMEALHQGPVRAGDLFGGRARLKAKDLMGLLLRHWAMPHRVSGPRCKITLRVFTPEGIPAVKIRCQ